MKEPTVREISFINGLLEIELDAAYDYRGLNFEGYNKSVYSKIHPIFQTLTFDIDSFSFSKKNVIRGFHGDPYTYKLIQCLHGELQLVVIDCRADSSTLGRSYTFFLHQDRPIQVLVPAGCVNGHLCLSEACVFSYKLSHEYVPQNEQIHLPWSLYNDWLLSSRAILSRRDSQI